MPHLVLALHFLALADPYMGGCGLTTDERIVCWDEQGAITLDLTPGEP